MTAEEFVDWLMIDEPVESKAIDWSATSVVASTLRCSTDEMVRVATAANIEDVDIGYFHFRQPPAIVAHDNEVRCLVGFLEGDVVAVDERTGHVVLLDGADQRHVMCHAALSGSHFLDALFTLSDGWKAGLRGEDLLEKVVGAARHPEAKTFFQLMI
ncbi:MAG TPA: hypothetical protein VGR35_08390 [Tepidisphaeraceae bacterium]|nr:hypothetical protein [Tepidisphaeraceae bacterium]